MTVYRTEAPETPPDPPQWILVVATKFYVGSTASDCLTWRETGICAGNPRPRICMSVINTIRRHIAAEKDIPVAAVHLCWFDLLVGDEEYDGK